MCNISIEAQNGHLEVVKFLVQHGADVTSQNNNPIRWASEFGHLEVVKFLVQHGADVTSQDNNPIRMASHFGHLEVVKFLVEHGADASFMSDRDKRYISFLKRRFDLCLRRFQLKCRLHLMRNEEFIRKQAERSYNELFGSL